MIEHFSCAFSDGSRVTVSLDLERMKTAQGSQEGPKFEWDGHPTRAIITEYVAWMHTVMSDVAKRINKNIMHVYPAGDGLSAKTFLYNRDGTFQELE